ncbi:MAG: Holliday junction resolvase RuvX [Bacillota bacterium]
MRILAVDYGQKRVGLAISDPLGITAQPLLTLKIEGKEDFIAQLEDIIAEYKVEEIVIGLPLHMNGTSGARAAISYEIAELIKDKYHLPVHLQDERLSSVEVEKVMLSGDLSRAKRKARRDKLAASLILRSYLANRQRR